MATENIYKQYFRAEGEFGGVERHGALVMPISDSADGMIRYEAAVTFFPHVDEEDFAVSYDAYFSEILYEGKGRRSKKREAQLLEGLREVIDGLAGSAGGRVLWEETL